MDDEITTDAEEEKVLQRGWTTGACATAATKAALTALITGEFPDPVAILLPKGEVPHFPLAIESLGDGYAMAGIIKDAGDDPDVTHGAMVIAGVRPLRPGSGIKFVAGDGVGTVTKDGLPIEKGEAAINPVPRQMMSDIVTEICGEYDLPADVEIRISIPDGEEIAKKTWNPRLGIVGGLSILGTTGIVHPFSCSAWIHSIHRGIDVARAEGLEHVMGATGSTSEKTAQEMYNLPEIALELGLNQNLKQQIQNANTALEVYEITKENDIDIMPSIAKKAHETAKTALRDAPIELDLIIINRKGDILAHAKPDTM
jgi:cobalt-precorrin-5B (C1)-methyltransferase